MIVLPGICVLRGRTSVPGLVDVLARTKSVDSPMLDIHLTISLEGKGMSLKRETLDIHRSRASDDEAIVIQDGGVLIYIS